MPAPGTDDTTSSSDKNKTVQPSIEEEDDGPVQSQLDKDKLQLQHLIDYGFNLTEEAKNAAKRGDGGKGGDGKDLMKAVAAAKMGRSNKNQIVVYGADPDDADVTDFNDDIYDDPDNALQDVGSDEDDDSDNEGSDEEEAGGIDMASGVAELPGHNYFEDYLQADDMWQDEDEDEEGDEEEMNEEDEEELERQRLEAYESAMQLAEAERERVRELRLAEIMKKKEMLIERYLKVARVMIGHRKKNIYLQDYLYHLGLRKGVLRGDPLKGGASGTMDSEESAAAKVVKQRQKKKNALMASRFGRFLQKTGHFYDDNAIHHHHHHHFGRHNAIGRASKHHHHHHHLHYNKSFIPQTLIRKNSKTCTGANKRNCPLNRKTLAKVKSIKKQQQRLHAKKSNRSLASRGRMSDSSQKSKPRNLAEILERKAQEMLQKTMNTATDTLEHFERHRCKMAKKKQVIKITKLLERHYSGMSLIEQERSHLVSFVETSVKAQNLAKRKAMKRQQKNQAHNKMGAVNLNHQWTKSLERIRELRLKKAKLEQEERLVLIRKVKQWNIWEKRNAAAIEGVYDFVTEMASRVIMSKGETLTFREGIEQFKKQLYSLHEAMLSQVIKMHKAQNILCMAQRHAKDNTSVAAPVKGFTISDFQRMIIENQESHQKLTERQEHLVEQYDKLKKYVKQVADSHLKKQRSWGTLRTGRHDMKQLWQLCQQERDNLLRKLKEMHSVRRLHRRLFMQISVIENRRLLKDFHQINRRVEELLDIERDLQTQLHQVQSITRILKVKYLDTQVRNKEAERQKQETLTRKNLQICRETIKGRIAPRVPNTVHSVNTRNLKSQAQILEADKQRIGTPNTRKQKNS